MISAAGVVAGHTPGRKRGRKMGGGEIGDEDGTPLISLTQSMLPAPYTLPTIGGLSIVPQLWYGRSIMTATVERIADEVKSLPRAQLDELLAWLAEYELQQPDEWDKAMERDSQPGGRLQDVIDRARKDIAAGRTKPLDEVLDNT